MLVFTTFFTEIDSSGFSPDLFRLKLSMGIPSRASVGIDPKTLSSTDYKNGSTVDLMKKDLLLEIDVYYSGVVINCIQYIIEAWVRIHGICFLGGRKESDVSKAILCIGYIDPYYVLDTPIEGYYLLCEHALAGWSIAGRPYASNKIRMHMLSKSIGSVHS